MKALFLAAFIAAAALANGDTYPVLKTLKGIEFKNVRVSEVEADGITIFHAGGVAKVLFRELPEELRRKYGYNPQAAAKAERDEAVAQTRLQRQAKVEAHRARIAQLERDIAHAEKIEDIERRRVAASTLTGGSKLDVTPEEQRVMDERRGEYLARKQYLKQLKEEVAIWMGKTVQ